MQSFIRSIVQRKTLKTSLISPFKTLNPISTSLPARAPTPLAPARSASPRKHFGRGNDENLGWLGIRSMSTEVAVGSVGTSEPVAAATGGASPRIKFKRLDKTAKHIMQILDKEAVEEVKAAREVPDIRPGYIVQLKVEVPENKRRTTLIKGVVIARRNAGLNTTFRIRRLVAGVGIESLFPLYSPNIKEIKVLEKKKVRRAKLYYLRDKMNALKKQSQKV